MNTYLVIRSSMDLGSRMNVGNTTRLRSAPGRSCEIMCDRTESILSAGVSALRGLPEKARMIYHFPGRVQQFPHPR